MTGITSRALALLRGSKSETKHSTSTSTGLDVFLSGATAVPAPFVAPARIVRPRGKLVFGFDATASRSVEWDATRRLQDVLFEAVPGELDIVLAVHGGGKLHTFTPFLSDAGKLRKIAAGIRCISATIPSGAIPPSTAQARHSSKNRPPVDPMALH
jgi:hypothetical protein